MSARSVIATNANGGCALTEAIQKPISIYKGTRDAGGSKQPQGASQLEQVRRDLADALNSKNVAFLFGSGCSSRYLDGEEVGIPTMAPMAQRFHESELVERADLDTLKSTLGIDVGAGEYGKNLERLMETLFGFQFALALSKKPELIAAREAVDRVIIAVKEHVLRLCLQGQSADSHETVLGTYERFYRRLSQRDRSLPRPWVFTTNYDLFNELAMDRLGIPYINGFQGSIERRFNPASFRHTIAEQLDIASRRWNSVDSLVYFAKLHGSLSWQSADGGLFPVLESMPAEDDGAERLLIYPTPAKQNASFASPYSDMFREFQMRVVREQSALITVGYSFSDEHVNNIIFQALTIPTFRLVAFVKPDANNVVRTLRNLGDPRIWIIGTDDDGSKWQGHYFDQFVDEFMPATGDDPTDGAVEKVLAQLINRAAEGADE
jgi:hypothetical protein